MQWDETWRHAERLSAADIPDEYSRVLPRSTQKWIVLLYFVGVLVVTYVYLVTLGTQAINVAGIPLLYWWAILEYLAFFLGVYVLVYRPVRRAGRPSAERRETPTTDEER